MSCFEQMAFTARQNIDKELHASGCVYTSACEEQPKHPPVSKFIFSIDLFWCNAALTSFDWFALQPSLDLLIKSLI